MQDISKILITIVQFFLQYVWVANFFFIIVIIMIEKKNPLYSIFWIFLLSMFPYVGFFIYLFFGLTFKKKRVANKIYKIKKLKSRKDVSNSDNKELKRWKGLITYLEMSTDNHISSNNDIQIYYTGEDFFPELKKEIANAKNFINMEYYIFRFDEIGKEIADLLIRKAKEGVEVNLIIDGVNLANYKLKRYFKNTGVNLHLFFRADYGLGRSFSVGLQMSYLLGTTHNVNGVEKAPVGDRFDFRGRFNANLGGVMNLPEQLDVYPGLSLSLKNFGGHIGARYFFNKGFGVFSEITFPIARYKTSAAGYERLNNQFTFQIGAAFDLN